jgi:hypothetical protein
MRRRQTFGDAARLREEPPPINIVILEHAGLAASSGWTDRIAQFVPAVVI